ncbi:uncharacterized protein METZ01_LOCUS162436 [marine metagenome]|uniref:Uncharacterized protein n=1 Tax=marine metagenome TaxID=408172 RepID=A0A382B8H1_9ZZZZ
MHSMYFEILVNSYTTRHFPGEFRILTPLYFAQWRIEDW